MGSRIGITKVAAGRLGLSVEDYLARIANGLAWCTAHKEWHERAAFTVNRSRTSGLAQACRRASSENRPKIARVPRKHGIPPPPHLKRRFMKHGDFKRRILHNGHWRVKSPGHPRCNDAGYVFEHILIVEKALGKFLPAAHPVHHFDGDGTNNLNTNLVVCEDNGYHALLHARQRVLAFGGDPHTQELYRGRLRPR